jgi:hypothetical protein
LTGTYVSMRRMTLVQHSVQTAMHTAQPQRHTTSQKANIAGLVPVGNMLPQACPGRRVCAVHAKMLTPCGMMYSMSAADFEYIML